MSEARNAALRAQTAAQTLALTSVDLRNQALCAMAQALREKTPAIIEANEQDMAQAKQANTKESLLDRLALDEERIEAMAQALEALAVLPDPLSRVLEERTLYNDLHLKKVSVPLGVVGMIYEARPNVTADAAGICLKSGNAAVLRGGSLALHSNVTITNVLRGALEECGLPADCLVSIESTDRAETDELLSLHGLVDVLIPRGGAGLIQHCVECAKVPVIETGVGNCHVYVHHEADQNMAHRIVINAKCRRYGVCNAAETLLVDASIASEFLPSVIRDLADRGVVIHGDKMVAELVESLHAEQGNQAEADSQDTQAEEGTRDAATKTSVVFSLATEEDWATEYLAPEIAIKCISSVEEAVDHINRYGTKHSEAIVTRNREAADYFCRAVDAAAVYVNTSTAFTDGGEFGLGAEIGISTQKLHVRGPFALEALTSYKYLVEGMGQVRG